MKNSLLFSMVVLATAMICAFGVSAQEAYAVYTSDNTTLSFYFDNVRSSRTGTTYDLNEVDNNPGWYSEGTNVNVTRVIFDPSFADARPTATYGWFYEMESLQSITGLEYLNTSEVTDMSWMFSYCKSLTRLDVSHFNTSKVTCMDGMFKLCRGLTRLDLSSFNTSKVTEMEDMFSTCINLQTIYVGNGWDTNAVVSSASMFYLCHSLVGGQGTTWDMSNPDDKTYAHIDGGPNDPGYFTERPTYTRGDVDDNLDVNVADVTALIKIVLNSETPPAAADCNLDDRIDVSDVTCLIAFILKGSWPEPVYTVVGTPNLFESDWDLNDERNNMTKGADGIYRLNKAGYFQEGTEIYFKIVCNHTYAYSWPAENRLIYIYETGAFSIDIIFDPNAPDDQKINIDMNKIF